MTLYSTSEPPEISTIVPSEFPVTISERTTPSPDHSSTVTAGKSTPEDCRLPGFLYRGKQRVTKSGILCQRWDVQSPHEHNYFIFSLAQENYCRNFDREEPWCFTTNSSVRWELCGVDICSSPCLNRSVDTQKIASQCFATEPTGIEFCSRLWRIVGCLKNRIEISTDIQCSGIELRSIALQRQDMLERLMGRSISQCIKAPCADSRLVSFERVVVLAFFCIVKHPMEETTSETLCR
ncbi:plasminogen-like [Saccostrea cucullata]|uniref:plasminogen-like n=1 Tax=Saccostrea cuccullata TaxID=36930 RepID=UPI002ED2BA8D